MSNSVNSTQRVPPIAYLVSSYPTVTHTFILREVIGLRALGLDIRTITMRATSADAVMSQLDRQERSTTVALRPFNKRRALKAWLEALYHPRAVLALARNALSNTGWAADRMVLQLQYAAEALVLWHHARRTGIRHFHAHFANNANEVGRLAVHYGNLIEPSTWKFTFTMHGPTGFFDVSRYSIAQKVESAAAVACISHFCKSKLLSVGLRVDWDKLQVRHLGTDVAPPAVYSTISNRILCVGRLVDKKGQRVLIKAVAALRARGRPVTCVLVGDGPLRSELELLVAQLDLQDVVTFLGARHQEDVIEELKKADVFCLPSFSEGLPIAVMEAMSWRVPVVTTSIAGVPELITHGVNGLLVLPADEQALTDALEELLEDKGLRDRLARNGRSRIEQYFTAEQAALRMKEFFDHCYRERADGHGPGSGTALRTIITDRL